LTADESASLQVKATRDETTIDAMLDTKIDQYLADVARDNGSDLESRFTKIMAEKSDADKEAMIAASV